MAGEEFDDRRLRFRTLYRHNASLRRGAEVFGLTAEEMGLALHYAALSKAINTACEPASMVKAVDAAQRTGGPRTVKRTRNIAPPPAQRAEWDKPPPVGKLWCDQCDRSVEAREVDACSSQWCKAKQARAAA